MIQEGPKESPGKELGAKSKVSEGSQKNGQRKQLGDTEPLSPKREQIKEEAVMEPRQKKQLPTKDQMA